MKRLAAAALIVATATAGAQGERQDAAGVRPLAQGNRAQLEASLRQEMARRAKVELGLNDDQMRRLTDVHRKFAQDERALDMRETDTRRSLRAALMGSPTADQDRRVGELSDQLHSLQQQRLDLVAAEQKDLSGFLTNVQRVRFQGLQENFRRQVLDALRPNAAPAGRRGRPPA